MALNWEHWGTEGPVTTGQFSEMASVFTSVGVCKTADSFAPSNATTSSVTINGGTFGVRGIAGAAVGREIVNFATSTTGWHIVCIEVDINSPGFDAANTPNKPAGTAQLVTKIQGNFGPPVEAADKRLIPIYAVRCSGGTIRERHDVRIMGGPHGLTYRDGLAQSAQNFQLGTTITSYSGGTWAYVLRPGTLTPEWVLASNGASYFHEQPITGKSIPQGDYRNLRDVVATPWWQPAHNGAIVEVRAQFTLNTEKHGYVHAALDHEVNGQRRRLILREHSCHPNQEYGQHTWSADLHRQYILESGDKHRWWLVGASSDQACAIKGFPGTSITVRHLGWRV